MRLSHGPWSPHVPVLEPENEDDREDNDEERVDPPHHSFDDPSQHSEHSGTSAGGLAQPTAFFTSARILVSAWAVSSFSAKEVGHMAPLSSFAASLNPNVAYRALNFS